jgi:hypothetical protein
MTPNWYTLADYQVLSLIYLFLVSLFSDKMVELEYLQ